MSNKLKNRSKIDWTIHAVYDPDDLNVPVDIHTHGLEKHKILNICMECPSRDQEMINFCANFINDIAMNMIDGETYEPFKTHMCDNAKNYNEVYHVFDLDIGKRDNGNGVENVYVADYWFDKIFFNPGNFRHYKFDHDTKKWKVI